jgi:predicted metal-dependent HD superfamily phosphohydrolase
VTDPHPGYQQTCARYAEPHRHYHTLEHIAATLTALDGARGDLAYPDEAELAVWLHDVIYEPRATDNEARSVAFAMRLLEGSGARARVAPAVAALIMATQHLGGAAAVPPDHPDVAHVVDMDLGILGATPEAFARYEAQVRREYAHRSEEEWREGRRRVLGHFLALPRIYTTPAFARLEAPARDNLARALARL